MSVLLDTSVIVSFFADDVHTEKAEAIMKKVLNGEVKAFVTPLVLAETCGAISRTSGRKNAETVLGKLEEWLSKNLISVAEDSGVAKGACELAIRHSLKGADALIAATAKHNGMQLITFDDELIGKLKLKAE